ncbi:hypothetical protein [Jannaschia formosa]|uniref:hypothetical protein n=1 Tax=Jannaschia formosa TaxID=2259592 RepID=UPI000E1C26F7|nr:hypothetical protein [Jannaschia formosa]TFL16846.1 hypothetical protein DR046_17720 [Jannaschia formosa]
MLDLLILLVAGLGTGFVALWLSERAVRHAARPIPGSGQPSRPYLQVVLHWLVFALVMGVIFGTGLMLAG